MAGGPFQTVLVGALVAGAVGNAAYQFATFDLRIDELAYDPAAGIVTYLPRAPGVPEDDRFHAIWSASVLPIRKDGTTGPARCSGSGTGRYWDRPDPLRWSLYGLTFDPRCKEPLPPGDYELLVTLTPIEPGSNADGAAAHSTFTVE